MARVDYGEVYGLYRRGTALLEQGDPRGAIAALEEAVAAEPDRASLWEPLGRAFFATAQLGRARSAFERLLEIDPSDHFAHFGVGRCWEREGDLRQAVTHYRIASALSPNADYTDALRRVQQRLERRAWPHP